MSRVAVLRPEPGASRTAARAADAGWDVIRLPLFETRPLAWEAPDPDRFDALLLTSAAALRHGGPGLDAFKRLPVLAVGRETAAAAYAAGFDVMLQGDAGAAALLERARPHGRLLHLAGRERMPDAPGVTAVPVYASEPLDVSAGATTVFVGTVALLHSARAARRFAELVDRDRVDRTAIRLVAISPAVLAAAGGGWADARAAAEPTDAALLDAARLTSPPQPPITPT